MFMVGCYIPRNFMAYSGHLILEYYSYFYLCTIYIAFSVYDMKACLIKQAGLSLFST